LHAIIGIAISLLKQENFKKFYCMVFKSIKRLIRKYQADIIQNKIAAGRKICFENTAEEIAFRYMPGEIGAIGKYFARYYGRNEFEIGFDSTSVVMGIMEGRIISNSRYERYHLIEGKYRKQTIRTLNANKQFVIG